MRKNNVTKKDLNYFKLLGSIKWGDSPHCGHCASEDVTLLESRCLYQCNFCRKQFNIFTGTQFSGVRMKPEIFLNACKTFYEMFGKSNPGHGGYVKVRTLQAKSGIKSYSGAQRIHKKLKKVFEKNKLRAERTWSYEIKKDQTFLDFVHYVLTL